MTVYSQSTMDPGFRVRAEQLLETPLNRELETIIEDKSNPNLTSDKLNVLNSHNMKTQQAFNQ